MEVGNQQPVMMMMMMMMRLHHILQHMRLHHILQHTSYFKPKQLPIQERDTDVPSIRPTKQVKARLSYQVRSLHAVGSSRTILWHYKCLDQPSVISEQFANLQFIQCDHDAWQDAWSVLRTTQRDQRAVC
jgi:hypothetical protein